MKAVRVVISRCVDGAFPGWVEDQARKSYDAGRSALEAGDLSAAIAELEASVNAFPHLKALELLGEAWLKKGEPQRALVPLAAATTLNAQVRAPSPLAKALLAMGDPLGAHRIVQLALQRDPNNKKARAVFEATAGAYEAWNKGWHIAPGAPGGKPGAPPWGLAAAARLRPQAPSLPCAPDLSEGRRSSSRSGWGSAPWAW
jgi:tetratricopeptide (TPR) repeat protein